MRKVDILKAWDNSDTLDEFCDKLGIIVTEYDDSIYDREGAHEYIEMRCRNFLEDGDLDGLQYFIGKQYIPGYEAHGIMNFYGDIDKFDYNAFCDFRDAVLEDHRNDEDFLETDGDKKEGDAEEFDSSFNDKKTQNEVSNQKITELLKGLF